MDEEYKGLEFMFKAVDDVEEGIGPVMGLVDYFTHLRSRAFDNESEDVRCGANKSLE